MPLIRQLKIAPKKRTEVVELSIEELYDEGQFHV